MNRQGVRVPILLDSDLGSDVDDELALALLWGSPEVELRGVCTSYGDAALRAGIVLRMAELAGRAVRVEPGERTPRSGAEVWWAGIEGVAYGVLPPLPEGGDGVQLLVEQSEGAHLLAIGPLTSVAAALDDGARFASITVMGGDWADQGAAEHNLASDVDAAIRVLGCGLPVTVVGVDLTRQVVFEEPEVRRFAALGTLGAVVATEMRAWMARWDEQHEVPHDPLTALALLQPELFTFSAASAVQVSDGTDGPAGAVRRLAEPGSVRIATGVDVAAARTALADRIAAGLEEKRQR